MSKGGTTSTGSSTEIPQWVQDAGRKQYQTGTELGQIGYTPYYGADVAAFNPLQTAAFDSTGMAANAFGMGGGSPTFATDGIQAPQTFAGGMRGYSGMPMYTEALNTLEQQRPYQKQQLEQQFIDPTTGLTPEGRKIQDINSLYNEAFGRNVGLEGVSTYLPLVQQGMTQNELRRVLYDSPEAKALGKSSLGAPIEIGVGGGLLGGAGYTPPVLPSGSSGILDSVVSPSVVPPTIADIAAGADTVDTSAAAAAAAAAAQAAEAERLRQEAAEAARLQQETKLRGLYDTYLDRSIQDAGLSGYTSALADGSKTMADIEADLAWVQSQGGEAALAAQRQAAINAQNLGFGASSVTGNAADDAAQIKVMNELLAANRTGRMEASEKMLGSQYMNNDQGDLMEVFKGAEEYRQGFVNDLSGLLDSLTGSNANSLVSSSTTDSSYTNGNNANNNALDKFVNFDTRDRRIDDYRNRFVSPY